MITAIHGDILTEPVRWQEDIGFLDGGKFHLRHDERFHIAMKDIKFDGVRRKRDKIPGLADNLTIGFGAQILQLDDEVFVDWVQVESILYLFYF